MTAANANTLLAAEEARRLAMLSADTEVLTRLLAETLVYVHSSGSADTRPSYLQQLASGALRYDTLAFDAPRVQLIGDVGLVFAHMRASVRRGETRREVASSYLAVWSHGAGGWTLQAVQASPLPQPG